MRAEDENQTQIVVSLRKELKDKENYLTGINDNQKYATDQVDNLKKVIASLQELQSGQVSFFQNKKCNRKNR